MVDPKAPSGDRRSPVDGVGPYQTGEQFPEVPALGAGESYRLNLRAFDRGRYIALSEAGYDSVVITNDSDQRLRATLNETNRYPVPSNAAKSIGHAKTYVIKVTNVDTSSISDAGGVIVEIQKDPLGADEAARRRSRQSPLSKVLEQFTGLGGV